MLNAPQWPRCWRVPTSRGAEAVAEDGGDEHVHSPTCDHGAPSAHAFSDMLHAASHTVADVSAFPDPGRLPEAEQRLADDLAKIERAGGRRSDAAKKAARMAIGGIRIAAGEPGHKPPRISTHKLLALIDSMIATLEGRQK